MTGSNSSPGGGGAAHGDTCACITHPPRRALCSSPPIMHASPHRKPFSYSHGPVDSLSSPSNGSRAPRQASRMERFRKPKRLVPGRDCLSDPNTASSAWSPLLLSPCCSAHWRVAPSLPRHPPSPRTPWGSQSSASLTHRTPVLSDFLPQIHSAQTPLQLLRWLLLPIPALLPTPYPTPPSMAQAKTPKIKHSRQTHSSPFLLGLHLDTPSRKSCERPAEGTRGPQVRRARCERADGLQGSGPGWGSQGGFGSRITKRHGPCTYLSQARDLGLKY